MPVAPSALVDSRMLRRSPRGVPVNSIARCVLLGGSGYIGSALARLLVRHGVSVRIADLAPSAVLPNAWTRTDVRDESAVSAVLQGAETLYLLAAEHGLEPRPVHRFEETNIGGARAVVAAARRTRLRRIIFTSTVAVYGQRREAATDDAPVAPTTAYGRTKLAAEQLLRAWANEDESRSLIIIRPTVVFGPGVRGQMRALFHRVARPEFQLIGAGENRKSFAHVENLAAFHAHATTLPPGTHLFNYTDGPDLTMREFAATIRSAVGLGPALPARARSAALARAAWQQLRAALGGPTPEWTVAQIRRFCDDSRFLSTRAAATGFSAPLTLAEGLAQYARSDLRWTAQRPSVTRSFTPTSRSDAPAV